MGTEQQSGHPVQDDEIDLLRIYGIIWRGRKFILATTTIVGALAVAYAILTTVLPADKSPLPNVYKPDAFLLVNDNRSSGLSSALSSSGLGSLASLAGVSTGGTYGELAIKLLKSGAILDPIAEEFHIAERYHIKKSVVDNSRKALIAHSTFSFDGKTNTVSVAFQDYDARFATDVVNRMVQLLQTQFSDIGGNRNLTRKDLLEQKLVDVKAQIERLADEVASFQRTHGFLTVNSLATEQVAALAQLRSSLIETEVQIQTYSKFSNIDDPTLARLRAQRDNLQKLVNEMEHGYSTYSDIGPSQKDMPDLAMRFETLRRSLDVQAKVYEMLMQQYEVAKLAAQGEEPVFQVLQNATVPDLKSGPSRSNIVLVAIFAAFVLSVIIVMGRDYIRSFRSDAEQMRKIRGEPR